MLSKYCHYFGITYLFIYNKIKRKVMPTVDYKQSAINEVTDALEILKAMGRVIQENKADKESVISNLVACINKLDKGLHYIKQK